MNIFIDIETLPDGDPVDPSTIDPPANYKNPDKIKAYQEEQAEKEFHKRGLISHKGKILCICYAINDQEPIVINGTEKQMLGALEDVVSMSRTGITWIGHNVTFDMLFIFQRAIKYGFHTLRNNINGNKYKGNIYCTMENMAGELEWKYRISLDDTAKFLGLETSKNGIDGSRVYEYWKAERVQEIYDYCRDDVILTRQVYRKLEG